MKTLLLIALACSTCLAKGPIYSYNDPHLDAEFLNVYKDIKNIVAPSTVTFHAIAASSATINNLTVTGPLGILKQTKYCSSTTDVTITATTWTDTTLTCSITPFSTSSTIIIFISQAIYGNQNSSSLAPFADIRIVRNGVAVQSWFNFMAHDPNQAADAEGRNAPIFIVDTPGTTTAVTYKTQAENSFGQGTVRLQAGSVGRSDILLLEFL